jgi:hypothetical protein
MIRDLNYQDVSPFEADIFEAGLIAEKWQIETDARIKTESNPVGTGPVIYAGEKTESGYFSDAAFLFFTPDRVSIAFLNDVDPYSDMTETITAYAESKGASIPAMLARAPEVN